MGNSLAPHVHLQPWFTIFFSELTSKTVLGLVALWDAASLDDQDKHAKGVEVELAVFHPFPFPAIC